MTDMAPPLEAVDQPPPAGVDLLGEASTLPPPEAPKPEFPDMTRWEGLGAQAAAFAGINRWKFGGTHPVHAYADQRAERIGRNTMLYGQPLEVNPETAMLSRRPDTNTFLKPPTTTGQGVAQVAHEVSKGKNPAETLGFVEGLSMRLMAEVEAHGQHQGADPSMTQATAVGFELARFGHVVDNLDVTGEDAAKVKELWGKLRKGEAMGLEGSKKLADAVISMARAMDFTEDPELNLPTLTMSVSGYDLDNGTVTFTAADWGGLSPDETTVEEVGRRLEVMESLHPSQLVEAMVENIESHLGNLENFDKSEPTPASVSAALGFPVPLPLDDQMEEAYRLVAARNQLDVADVHGAMAKAWADKDQSWTDGQGPGSLESARIFRAVTGPSMAEGLPFTAAHLSTPKSMSAVSGKDFQRYVDTPDAPESDRVDIAEVGDGTFSALATKDSRSLYLTELRTPDGRRVAQNRRPEIVPSVKAIAKLATDGGQQATLFHGEIPPFAFQPGYYARVSVPVNDRGRIGERVLGSLEGKLQEAVKVAATGRLGAARQMVNGDEIAVVGAWFEVASMNELERVRAVLGEDAAAEATFYTNGERLAGMSRTWESHFADSQGYATVVSGTPVESPGTAVSWSTRRDAPAQPAPLNLRQTSTGWALNDDTPIAGSPDVAELKMANDDGMDSLWGVRWRGPDGGQWKAPNHIWVNFSGPTPQVTYAARSDSPMMAPFGVAVKVTRGGVQVANGPHPAIELDRARRWLQARGIENRFEDLPDEHEQPAGV